MASLTAGSTSPARERHLSQVQYLSHVPFSGDASALCCGSPSVPSPHLAGCGAEEPTLSLLLSAAPECGSSPVRQSTRSLHPQAVPHRLCDSGEAPRAGGRACCPVPSLGMLSRGLVGTGRALSAAAAAAPLSAVAVRSSSWRGMLRMLWLVRLVLTPR